jgi:hypothetical protein
VRVATSSLEASRTYLLVVSGLRTAAQQNALYAQGRTTPGHIVTNARAGHSIHNYGLAVDVVPYLSGQSGNVNWDEGTPQFQAMVAALKAQGLVWGGDWISIKDHFQMPGLPASPTEAMISDYGSGEQVAMNAIWANTEDGKYES